jgi:hypothetical protein
MPYVDACGGSLSDLLAAVEQAHRLGFAKHIFETYDLQI